LLPFFIAVIAGPDWPQAKRRGKSGRGNPVMLATLL